LVIKEGTTELFNGTLAGFFAQSAEPDKALDLTAVPNGGSTQYDFYATFRPETGDDFQEVTLDFNLTFGITNPPPSGGGEVGAFGGATGSGGSGIPTPPTGLTGSGNSNNGLVEGTSTNASELAYESILRDPSKSSGFKPLSTSSGAKTFIPVEEVNAAAIGTQTPGQILGESTSASPQTCSPHFAWWWIGYLVYVVLLFAYYFILKNKKAWWAYALALALPAAAIYWWWIEPCAMHYLYWSVLIAIFYIALSLWHFVRKGNNSNLPETQTPLL
jgi:hypothetical protein